MIAIRVLGERRLDPAMERLRAEGLGYPGGSVRDHIDHQATHVTALGNDAPIGMVRVSRGLPSVLAAWTVGEWPLPVGDGIAELTRGVVAADWRALGVYRLLMLVVMAGLPLGTVALATAAIEPDFVGRGFLESLGFEASAPPVTFDDLPRRGTVVVPIVARVNQSSIDRWAEMLSTARQRMGEQGIVVQLDCTCVMPEVPSRAAYVSNP